MATHTHTDTHTPDQPRTSGAPPDSRVGPASPATPDQPPSPRNRPDLRPADLVRVEAAALTGLADRLDDSMASAFSATVDLLVDTVADRHRVLLTGIGKSGIIARKLAATLRSTGTPAHFLHPSEALHGDLGMLTPGDVVVALSSSGETEELLSLLPLLERTRTDLIAVCGCPTSTLATAARLVLDVSISAEACPHNLAPTASTTVMLALGDALALSVSQRRGFQPEDFADLHPGGRLGKRLTRVRDLMHTGDAIPTVAPTTLLPDIIYEMSRKKLGMTTVLSSASNANPDPDYTPNPNSKAGHLLGVISDGDLRRLFGRDGANALSRTAAEVMNPHPLTIDGGAYASTALALMENRKITNLIVVTPNPGPHLSVQGVVHLHDLWALQLP